MHKSSNQTLDNTGFVTAYTDISGSPGLWAYAYYVKCSHGVLTKAELIDQPMHDTNMAEMFAINKAIDAIINKFTQTTKILVVTDSRNAQQILWRGSDIEKYAELVAQFRQYEQRVKVLIKWTKAHRHDESDRTYLNNRCDKASRSVVRQHQRSMRGV